MLFFRSETISYISESVSADGFRYVELFWKRKIHFIAELHETDIYCGNIGRINSRLFYHVNLVCPYEQIDREQVDPWQ